MCALEPQRIRSDQAINIESHFVVTAGPGAGKTYWLITHIRNVLHNSQRLGKTGKVACITYTNQAVKEIRDRLGEVAGRVQVATIHSFLYNNVLRPHAFLLKGDDGRNLINLRQLDGHDEHIPSQNMIYRWKADTKQPYLKDDEKVKTALSDLDWHIEDGDLALLPRKRWLLRINNKLWIRRDSLIDYKKLYWNVGQIHHEDVLYFSYRLIFEHPRIVEFLRAKFPYIFIDEFQDTHPLQTAIIREIANADTIIGVIGDPAQSIFSFMGAMRKDFIEFKLNGQKNYVIEDNRRSTNQIVELLNNLRPDLTQKALRNEDGEKPLLIVGDKFDCMHGVQKYDPAVLARNNSTLSALKKEKNPNAKIWDEYRAVDTNYRRVIFLYRVFCSIEYLRLKDFRESLRIARKLFRTREDGSRFSSYELKSSAIKFLDFLWKEHIRLMEKTIQGLNNDLYKFLLEETGVKMGAKISSGRIAEFASAHIGQEMLDEISISDDIANIRTIHKAKGTEFDNVLVVLEDEMQLEQLLNAELEHQEDESRIYYVALSRARNRLFVSVPSICDANKQKAEELGFIIRLQDEDEAYRQ
jgi:DNA helicase-2/ATP-dependent DNA helicase PcrA